MDTIQTGGPACSLDARDFQDRVRWITDFNTRALRHRQRQHNALIATYAPGHRTTLAELIAKEADCCGFLKFDLQEGLDGDVLTISVQAEHALEADALLSPFDGSAPLIPSACCGVCR